MVTPISRDEIDDAVAKEHERFQRALGRMTMLWADLENNLYIALRNYSGVSDAVGKALFSGSRAAAMIMFIRAIAHNTKLQETNRARFDDLEETFSKISEINAMRDLITHHAGASLIEFDEDDPTTRYLKKHRVSRRGNELKIKVGSALLDSIGADLLECCWRLHAHAEAPNKPFTPESGAGPDGKRHAWRYRSPLQGNPAKPNQSTARKPPRPPRPSQGK